MFAIGLITLFTVLGLSLIITRVATVALSLTGLSYESARFQARSAFTGTGFTTREAESVVNHPVRRRIIMALMILRSAGLITIIISLLLSFLDAASKEHVFYRLLFILLGICLIWAIANSRIIERFMRRIIGWALTRWTSIEVRDYASLLQLSGNYSVRELSVKESDWLNEKDIERCHLADEGALILGIVREDGRYVGAPRPGTKIHSHDTLIIYGPSEVLSELDERRDDPAGDQAHEKAKQDHREHLAQQDRQEADYQSRRRR